MSRELIESIISNNMIEANEVFEAKLAEIRERKMYEMKRMYAAKLDEVFGPWQPGGNPDDLRAKGYKKAEPELERREAEKAAREAETPSEPKKKKKDKKKPSLSKRIMSSDFMTQLSDIGSRNL